MTEPSSEEAPPDLSLVILSWNTKDYLRACLEHVRAGTGGLRTQIVVIDNASHDGSADMVAAEFPEVELHRNAENRGYALGVNQGLSLSRGRTVGLLGSDTEVTPEALPRLLAFLDAHPEAGVVAPRLLNFDGTTQRACMRFPSLATALTWDTPVHRLWPDNPELRRYEMRDWDHRGTREVEQPPGTCLVVTREFLDVVGPMDGRLWLFFNDVDWMLRARRAAFEVWYLDEAEVRHHLGGSTKGYADFAAEWHRNRVRFYAKHFGWPGSFLTKLAAVYVALRQCVRISRELPFGPEFRSHCRGILGLAREILLMNPRRDPLAS